MSGLVAITAVTGEDANGRKEVERRFNEGICTDYEYLRVAGHRRMHLVFKLLNQDLIERHGAIDNGDAGIEHLAQRITAVTGVEAGLVEKTLSDLAQRGYLKSTASHWYWTHNNRTDVV